MFGAAKSGSESRSSHQLGVKGSDATLIQRLAKGTLDVMPSRRPADFTTGVTSSRGLRRKTSETRSASDELNDRDVELQQQMFISRLLDSKSSSRRHAAIARQPRSRDTTS